jgi:hypothetical protein
LSNVPKEITGMTRAWTEEWVNKQAELCKADAEYQDEVEGYDRSVVMHVLADPARGVEKDLFVGFDPSYMDNLWAGEENKQPDADYIIEGTYEDWWAVNEGKKCLVASLLDQSIMLRSGKTSYIAMFVPAVDRFYTISRGHTDTYDGDYKKL